MHLLSIPALRDNYIWLLANNNKECIIIDPSNASPVITTLQQHQLRPLAILLTHHHDDHTHGVKILSQLFHQLPVYGPEETRNKGTNHIVCGNNILSIGSFSIEIMDTPGHTNEHLSYYCYPYLFCGDTLFSGGCGRLLGGTAQQLYTSLQTITQLPDDTLLCCAHEYTLANLHFAHAIFPEDFAIQKYLKHVTLLRQQQQSTLPILLEKEKRINLFLRCQETALQKQLGYLIPADPLDVFTLLRKLKDNY